MAGKHSLKGIVLCVFFLDKKSLPQKIRLNRSTYLWMIVDAFWWPFSIKAVFWLIEATSIFKFIIYLFGNNTKLFTSTRTCRINY